jgi:arylsulfatase A-like enzyme/Flp pilus assembly protein TadD
VTTPRDSGFAVRDSNRRRIRASERVVLILLIEIVSACGGTAPGRSAPAVARNLLLITIDTLRADHVGAYGYAPAHTPTFDGLARRGVRFDRAFATAPITLVSHASILTGRYPAGHGARDNGMHVRDDVPQLAAALKARGFQTAAFVAAFPLDRRFGLARGFDVYSDRLPRGADGRPLNERPGREVVDEAIAWLQPRAGNARFFLWVHLFEPHAPYGSDPRRGTAIERYDEEIATADREAGRLVAALGSTAAQTLIVLTGDHGEAFGEHEEFGHSVFIYDTTLRVPLILAGPGIAPGVLSAPVSLIDVAPSAMAHLGEKPFDADGVDLSSVLAGGDLPTRELYAESLAPLVEFGWAPLRSVRSLPWKLIDAPDAELYDVANDPSERVNLRERESSVAERLTSRVQKYGGTDIDSRGDVPADARARLGALGYVGGGHGAAGAARADPKTRRTLAARIGQVTSGELQGSALKDALTSIVTDDPGNTQAHLRLAALLVEENACDAAIPHLRRVIAQQFPSADPYIMQAACAGRRGDVREAVDALEAADRVEPGNPVVIANLGIAHAASGSLDGARASLERALQIDPTLDEARFNLARVYARLGRRADAAREAQTLLSRLPANAPQRAEVERLLAAVR